MVFWRICRRVRARTAFDGEGARLYPGRWNHKDVPVVYCAESLSLAVLENFVHVEPNLMPDDLVSIRAELPDGVPTERVEEKALPTDWNARPGPTALRDLGTAWALSLRTVALLVPSVIVPIDHNIILNPKHPDMAKLVVAAPQPFSFDPRMRKKHLRVGR